MYVISSNVVLGFLHMQVSYVFRHFFCMFLYVALMQFILCVILTCSTNFMYYLSVLGFSFREPQEGYLMMEGTMNIPVSLIESSRALQYIYGVCKYQNPDMELYYEYLQYPDCDKQDNVYRSLIIPVTAAHARGMRYMCMYMCMIHVLLHVIDLHRTLTSTVVIPIMFT